MANSRLCSIPDCGKPHLARDLCSAHYSNWRNHGDPQKLIGSPKGVAAKFLKSFLASPPQTDECLIWPHNRNNMGYGFTKGFGFYGYVHRIVCESTRGAAPTKNHEASHECGKGHLGCINPRHLQWKTHQQNHMDRFAHGTVKLGSEHHAARLTENQIPEIIDLLQTMNNREIADRYGVAPHTISDIRCGKTWRHVD